MIVDRLKAPLKAVLPEKLRRWLRGVQHNQQLRFHGTRPVGWVRFGNLRRLTPISPVGGWDRGLSINRFYIYRFMAAHAADIQGRVLEFTDAALTTKFGGDRVTHKDVMHYVEGNPKATIVADLTSADHVPSDVFDCIICTQTLHVIYDVHASLRHLYRILKPGGVLLVTVPGISKTSRWEKVDPWGTYWKFTHQGTRLLFLEQFPETNVTIEVWGNVLVAVASLMGLASQELTREELDYRDPKFELLITVRAVKPDVSPLDQPPTGTV